MSDLPGHNLQPRYDSPLAYGSISSVFQTQLTLHNERQRNDNYNTTNGRRT
jgi:hypothetical protein